MRNSLKMRHHQGGGHSFTANIRTEKAHSVVIEEKKVIEIAAHDPGRRCYAAHLCATQNGCKPRVKILLHFLSQCDVTFQNDPLLLLFPQVSQMVRHRIERGDEESKLILLG